MENTNKIPKEIKIVKVGSDDYPASEADLEAVQEELAALANDPTLPKTNKYKTQTIKPSGKGEKQILFVKLGNRHRYASESDLDSVREEILKSLKDLKNDNLLTWVVPHDFNIKILNVDSQDDIEVKVERG